MAQVANEMSSVTTYCNPQVQRGSQSRFVAEEAKATPLGPHCPSGSGGQQVWQGWPKRLLVN